MTNKEATKYLITPVATSTEPSAEYLKQKEAYDLAIKALEEEPIDELIETKHRLNLLIGVLHSNQVIWQADIEYIEDSIKKLMKGEKAM